MSGFDFIDVAIPLPLQSYFCSSATENVVFLNCMEQDVIWKYF